MLFSPILSILLHQVNLIFGSFSEYFKNNTHQNLQKNTTLSGITLFLTLIRIPRLSYFRIGVYNLKFDSVKCL